MIMLFLMSYSLLCRTTNDPPRHPRRLWTAPTPGWCISNLSGVGVAVGEVLVSQVFNKPYWGASRAPDPLQMPPFTRPISSLLWPPPRHPTPTRLPRVPRTISHHALSFVLLFKLSSTDISVAPPLPFPFSISTPPSLSHHLPESACLRSTLPAFLQRMPGLLGHQLHSEDFIWKSSSGRHYKDHHRASRLMLH